MIILLEKILKIYFTEYLNTFDKKPLKDNKNWAIWNNFLWIYTDNGEIGYIEDLEKVLTEQIVKLSVDCYQVLTLWKDFTHGHKTLAFFYKEHLRSLTLTNCTFFTAET